MTKLERIGNYFIRTNTDDNTTVEYPANEARYRLSEDSYFLTSINDASIGEYFKFADLLDGDGNAWTDIATLTAWLRQNTGDTVPSNFTLDLAFGNVDGYETFEKYGRNSLINANTVPEDIWNGGDEYTGFPTGAAETLEVFSSDGDDNATGTGAQTIEIFNLQDGSGNEMPNVTVSLDGTTPVSLGAQTYYRAGTRMKILTAGSGGENVGEITLRHTSTTANVFAVMPANKNQTAIACYSVPLGHTLYINRINFQMARTGGLVGSASVTFRARPFGGVFNTVVSPEITESSNYDYLGGYYVFDERTDIKCRCDDVSDNGTIITAEFSGILITN